MKNCKVGGCLDRSHTNCPQCIHWVPSNSHKYYNCQQYLASRTLCDLPKSSCKNCAYHIKADGMRGRPNNSGVDWNDIHQVRDYLKKSARIRRGTIIKLTISKFTPNKPNTEEK